MDKAKLYVLSGSQVGHEVDVTASLIIGRSTAAGLSLKDSTVSREHARIVAREGHWLLVDLKSSNGTKVGGRPITRHELHGGEEILVGDVRLRFQRVEAEVEAGPAGDDLEIEWDDDPKPDAPLRSPSPAPTKPAAPAPESPSPQSPVAKPAAPRPAPARPVSDPPPRK